MNNRQVGLSVGRRQQRCTSAPLPKLGYSEIPEVAGGVEVRGFTLLQTEGMGL